MLRCEKEAVIHHVSQLIMGCMNSEIKRNSMLTSKKCINIIYVKISLGLDHNNLFIKKIFPRRS